MLKYDAWWESHRDLSLIWLYLSEKFSATQIWKHTYKYFLSSFFLVQSLNMNFSLEKGFEIFPAEHILFNPLLACILFGIIYHLMTWGRIGRYKKTLVI